MTNGETKQNAENQLSNAQQTRKLFAQPCRFVMGATAPSQLPPPDMLEIAFAGRSNVGKSSLINALVQQKALAKTSGTPGRTQQINFFECGKTVRLVDLPGYGYAKASKKDIRSWTGFTLAFLKKRPNLRRVLLLVDARRGIGDKDREIMDLLDTSAVSWALVLTKTDKLKPPELEAVTTRTLSELSKHVAAWPGIFPTSAAKATGLDELREHIAELSLSLPR